MARKIKQSDFAKRLGVLSNMISGRESASSTSLSRSYDIPIDQVRRVMQANGVKDDG